LWIPIFFVIFGLFAAIFFLDTRDLGCMKWFFRGFILFLVFVGVVFTAYYFLRRRNAIQAYTNGKYKIVEGPVEHYSWKAKHECFSVRGVEFCHGTANPIGWDPPLRLGPSTWPLGFLRDGLPVRIAYSDDQYPKILRLDIGRSSR